jgi:Flp pilus assembly protein TadG
VIRLRSLLREERGAAIIELAIIAPVIALMTVGVVDLSNGFGQKLKLEQAAQRSIEKVMQTTGVTTVEDTIASEALCQVNGLNTNGTCKTSPITAANVTVTYRLECLAANNTIASTQSSTDADAFDALECPTGQKDSRWVKVAIWQDYTPMFSVHFTGIDNGGKYRIQASAGIRTE